jgi:IclR family acetate operon transcriptional repressor
MSGPAQPLLVRAFSVLAAFAPGHPERSLAELTEITGVPRSTVHRLAGQLVELGALERTPRGWRLGMRMFELGQLVPAQQRLREAALPHMSGLYEASRQTVQLAVLDEREVVYIEVLHGRRKVPSPSRRGGRMPAHCTAVGKVLMAFGPDARIASGDRLTARTRFTITEPAALHTELADIRRSALAFDNQEAMLGLRCVAAPVLGHGTVAVAALSVSMPADGDLAPEAIAPAVRAAALALGRDLRGPVTRPLPGRPPGPPSPAR